MKPFLPTAAPNPTAQTANVEKTRTKQSSQSAAVVTSLIHSTVTMETGRSFVRYWSKVWQITAKDLRIELRAKEIIGVMLAFSTLAILIFGLAFDLRVPSADMVVPGVLWGTLLFSGTLGLNRSFSTEQDQQTLLALLLAPVDRTALYVGKCLANLLFMGTMSLLLIPLMLFIFDVNLFRFWILIALLLGIIGYIGVGTLFAALTASVRARESMLPILLLPVLAPVFMAGMKVTEQVLDGRLWPDFQNWLGMLVGFDLVFVISALLVFDLVWEDI